ncbi:MAG: helix-hairpin-helix domain-containing protein [Ornithinibacter sp.]
MPRRPPPEALSPRALARLRATPGSYVPTELDLEGLGPASDGRHPVESAGERARPTDRLDRLDPLDEVDEPDVRGGGRHARARHPRGWVRLPAAFVGARWQPGRAALLGITLVILLAAAVFGLRVAWAQSAGGGTVIAPGGGSRAGPSAVTAGAVPVGVSSSAGSGYPGATPAASAGAAAQAAPVQPSAPQGVVVVHVVGRVKHPGVRRLPVGSRVTDAVEAAGGVATKADLSALNLARVLVDGEQVRVPAVGEPVARAPTAGAGSATSGGAGSGSSGAPVSINTADLAGLDSLPGVGPVLAQRILDWRSSHGRFTSIDELGEVSGIGEKLLAQLTPLVTL